MNCPYNQKHISKVLYKSNKTNNHAINVTCTSLNYVKPTLFKCEECDLIFSELYNSPLESNYSEVVDTVYIDQIKSKKKYFQLVISKIEEYLTKESNVLEIGSYYGVLGSLLKPRVKEYNGIELSKHGADFSKKNFNLKIYNDKFENYIKFKSSIDVIIMSHVIEHLGNPFQIIKLIEQKMNLKSTLIFSTYNMDSFIARILGYNYQWIMPMHLYYFSRKTLKKILQDNNLKIVKIKQDVHIVSLKYFFLKLSALVPLIGSLFLFMSKIKIFEKFNIKINLGDLDIYFVKKIK